MKGSVQYRNYMNTEIHAKQQHGRTRAPRYARETKRSLRIQSPFEERSQARDVVAQGGAIADCRGQQTAADARTADDEAAVPISRYLVAQKKHTRCPVTDAHEEDRVAEKIETTNGSGSYPSNGSQRRGRLNLNSHGNLHYSNSMVPMQGKYPTPTKVCECNLCEACSMPGNARRSP